MGSGKTTVGKRLARALDVPFVDLDEDIEKQEQQTIAEIFEKAGEKAFRILESSYLLEIIRQSKPSVISLGGGTICFNQNLELVKKSGKLIYLELNAAALADRLGNSKTQRPLLKNIKEDQLVEHIEKMLSLRRSFYEQADITINALNLSPQAILQKLSGEDPKHTA